jgi:hypothetical protein
MAHTIIAESAFLQCLRRTKYHSPGVLYRALPRDAADALDEAASRWVGDNDPATGDLWASKRALARTVGKQLAREHDRLVRKPDAWVLAHHFFHWRPDDDIAPYVTLGKGASTESFAMHRGARWNCDTEKWGPRLQEHFGPAWEAVPDALVNDPELAVDVSVAVGRFDVVERFAMWLNKYTPRGKGEEEEEFSWLAFDHVAVPVDFDAYLWLMVERFAMPVARDHDWLGTHVHMVARELRHTYRNLTRAADPTSPVHPFSLAKAPTSAPPSPHTANRMLLGVLDNVTSKFTALASPRCGNCFDWDAVPEAGDMTPGHESRIDVGCSDCSTFSFANVMYWSDVEADARSTRRDVAVAMEIDDDDTSM